MDQEHGRRSSRAWATVMLLVLLSVVSVGARVYQGMDGSCVMSGLVAEQMVSAFPDRGFADSSEPSDEAEEADDSAPVAQPVRLSI